MSAYTPADEERVRLQALVREWQRSGLLEAPQVVQLDADLGINLRRTHLSFRAVLFLFTVVIIAASLELIITVLNVQDKVTIVAACFLAAVTCLGAAEFLVARFRLYRFGVEEALAKSSPVLLSIAVSLITGSGTFQSAATLITGACAGLGVYLWFGYVDIALLSMMAAAGIPFVLDLSPEMRRLLVAAFFVCIFIFTRPRRLLYGEDFPGDEYGILQAASWAGLYFALNLQIGSSGYAHGLFYWLTYAMTFVLPVIGALVSFRHKDRHLMHATLVMALVTLVTARPYLGLTHRPWDPILFGIFLMASAIVIKRWLSNGQSGHRQGFTATRLLAGDRRTLTAVGAASAMLHPDMPAHDASPAKPDFGGGRSGGAGASGSF